MTDAVNAAASVLTDPVALFDADVDHSGGAAQLISGLADSQQQQAFVDAFNNGQVSVQNAVQVKGLNYTDHTLITGKGEQSDVSFSAQGAADPGVNTVITSFPAIGGLYVTWPKVPVAPQAVGFTG